MSGGRSRHRRECGKAAGVVDGPLRTETSLAKGRAWATYRQRRPANGRQAVSDRSEKAVSRNGATASKREPLEEFRPPPASGRCGVSPLEWGRARLRLDRRGKAFPQPLAIFGNSGVRTSAMQAFLLSDFESKMLISSKLTQISYANFNLVMVSFLC